MGGEVAKEKLDSSEESVYSERWRREAIYLSQDRVDMQFAAKEVSRFTSKTEEQDWSSGARFSEVPKDDKRVVIECKLQRMPEKVVVWPDTDFAC